MNNVSLVGRLTKEPDVKYANSGTTIARLTVACDRKFKQEGQPTADFINCLAFGKTAEFIEKYFNKGSRIGLCGEIRTGSYENKDGQKVYTTDVVINSVEFVESKGSASAPTKKNDEFVAIPEGIDEELPFN